jgi:membrane-associated phospholipid phosphatase
MDRLAADAAESRVLGGIHFPSDSLAGLSLGRAVAAAALR